MGNNNDNINPDFRTAFFIFLFFCFVLLLSEESESNNTVSLRHPLQIELVSGDISGHHNTIICSAIGLPELRKYCEFSLLNTYFNPVSIQNKISDYNRRIAQSFILINKARLSIEPITTLRFYYHLPANRDDYLPDLS